MTENTAENTIQTTVVGTTTDDTAPVRCFLCGGETQTEDSVSYCMADCTEADDDDHDALHSAAEDYASTINNAGQDAQCAFLTASGLTEQAIVEDADGDGEDALDMLVIVIASLVASQAYNNDGTPDGVTATLLGVYDPDASANSEAEAEAEAEDEDFGPYDWTCTYCGSGLNEDNFDETGSRKCFSDNHSEHLDEGVVTEFEDESHG